jgi:predicted metal-dependent phosphoesterase TrpH
MIDLHIHTTASSDGIHNPEEIFQFANSQQIRYLAFADHNSINSVPDGIKLAKKYKINFISGIEINTNHFEHDLHILAYGFDPSSNDFKLWLNEIEKKRWEQARGRVEKLKKLGFAIDWEDVIKEGAPNVVPTGINFLKALLGREENSSDPRLSPYRPGGNRSDSPYLNFYLDYLRGGKPAYVPQENVESIKVIPKILDFNAIPVLAHPSDTPLEFIEPLVSAGLKGMEVFSSYHDEETTKKWLEIAKIYNLLLTAGSDFHGLSVKPNVKLGGIPSQEPALFFKLVENLPHNKGVVISEKL